MISLDKFYSLIPKDKKDLTAAVFEGLIEVYKNHISLGESGKAKDKENRFGDMALRADVEAEENVIERLKDFAEKSRSKIIYQGEETGIGQLGQGEKTYSLVLDGLDGSSNYAKKNSWPYGTMVAVASNNNPTYDDFEIAGEMLPEEGWIVLALKGVGVFVYQIEEEMFIRLKNFDVNEKFDDKKTLANKYFPEEIEVYGDKSWVMTGSTAASIVAVCVGDQVKDKKFPNMNLGWNGIIEVTRKKNLEQPVLYLLIIELGGMMVDRSGKPIGSNNFKSWSQARDGEDYLVTAKNMKIAKEILTLTGI